VEAITYLNERNPTAAAKLDAEIMRCIDRLADCCGVPTWAMSMRKVCA